MRQVKEMSEDIKDIIKKSLLLDVDEEESLFESEKIDRDFLLYLLPMLENKYGVILDDLVILQENLDSVKRITELFKKAR